MYDVGEVFVGVLPPVLFHRRPCGSISARHIVVDACSFSIFRLQAGAGVLRPPSLRRSVSLGEAFMQAMVVSMLVRIGRGNLRLLLLDLVLQLLDALDLILDLLLQGLNGEVIVTRVGRVGGWVVASIAVDGFSKLWEGCYVGL